MSKDSKFEFHFYGSVGQQIARVENMTVNFDKDMQMHIAQVEQVNIPQQQMTEAAKEYCPYIQQDKLQEVGVYTIEQFDNKMSKEAEKTAPQFAKFLHLHMKSGYLNFGDHSKLEVFNTLHIYYPNMKGYRYNNFALYF